MQSGMLSAVTHPVWVLVVLCNNFFRERYVTVTISWKKKKKKIINWHTHFISTTRKCSFLAMGRDGSQLVPGHFTALLISCVCSIGRHAYCNCFASCLHTFSRPDSSIACREFNVGKLHHADCRGTQQRCLASSTNIIVLHTDTAFYACIISDTRNSFPTTNSISRILMGCKI